MSVTKPPNSRAGAPGGEGPGLARRRGWFASESLPRCVEFLGAAVEVFCLRRLFTIFVVVDLIGEGKFCCLLVFCGSFRRLLDGFACFAARKRDRSDR